MGDNGKHAFLSSLLNAVQSSESFTFIGSRLRLEKSYLLQNQNFHGVNQALQSINPAGNWLIGHWEDQESRTGESILSVDAAGNPRSPNSPCHQLQHHRHQLYKTTTETSVHRKTAQNVTIGKTVFLERTPRAGEITTTVDNWNYTNWKALYSTGSMNEEPPEWEKSSIYTRCVLIFRTYK